MSPSTSQNPLRIQARDRLRSSGDSSRRVVVGLDGFVDEIVHAVDRRLDFESYSRLSTMAAYAERIAKAAGKSCNIEWVVKSVKLGGNGPIMAAAMGEYANHVLYIGAVGFPDLHPVFEVLNQYGPVVSLAPPGYTHALEFDDGKIMHGKIETMKLVRWERLLECMDGEGAVRRLLIDYDLIALTNWTMVPFSNGIYENLFALAASDSVPNPPLFFIDLADPEKRTRDDLKDICTMLGDYSRKGLRIILGLNHKEALQVADVHSLTCMADDSPSAIATLASGIQAATGITEVVVHPRRRAAAATAEGTWCVEGPFTPKPVLSTGAGDHFNAGYCQGRLHGLEPDLALIIGKATSGHYVRYGKSPSPADTDDFLTRWANDQLPQTA